MDPLSTTQVQNSVIPDRGLSLPKTIGYLTTALGIVSVLASCTVSPYAYGTAAPRPRYNPPAERPTPGANNPDYQNMSIEEQTKNYQNEASRLSAYNQAVQASSRAMLANIPPMFQNQNTRQLTLMQARASMPQDLSATEYRKITLLKQAEEKLAYQRQRAYRY